MILTHPVRFSIEQIDYITDIIKALDLDQGNYSDLESTIKRAENRSDMIHPVRFSPAQIHSVKSIIGHLLQNDYDLGKDQIPSIITAINSAELDWDPDE